MLATTPDFSAAHIIVVGDVMLDRYWSGKAARISPEAPVPVVQVDNIEERVGGAGNVALNIAKLGGKVTLLAVVGDDHEGQQVKALLEAEGVHCDFVVAASGTICKLRIMAQHQQLIRIDFENTPLVFEHVALMAKLHFYLDQHKVVVFSDYGKGTLRDIRDYIAIARKAGLRILVDPKGNDYSRYESAHIITPNVIELEAVAGVCRSEEEIIDKARQLLKSCQLEALLLTRGEAGMTLVQANDVYSLPAQAKDVFDVTGAGDTVIAVMALCVGLDMSLHDSMYLANLSGGIVVGKLGTSTVSSHELSRAMHGDRDFLYGVVSEEELVQVLASARAHGEKVVMTNGCFDLLHAGHVTYLEQAKALGDRLVVAVNSDASVRQLKGDSRPINKLPERMAVLAALACVDWVVSFEEQTPERLYCRILPDILVKGGDYTREQVAGGDCVVKAGGGVCILPFVEGQSTTAMINRAKERT